jgi:hypothetical protein
VLSGVSSLFEAAVAIKSLCCGEDLIWEYTDDIADGPHVNAVYHSNYARRRRERFLEEGIEVLREFRLLPWNV